MLLAPTRRAPVAIVTLVAALALASTSPRAAVIVPDGFANQVLVEALGQPVSLAEIPDAPGDTARRVLVVEQVAGSIVLYARGLTHTLGFVPGVNTSGGERGLLGIAVDPGWPARPYVYTHSTDNRSGNHVVISRWTLAGDLTNTGDGLLTFDAATRYDLIRSLPDNASNHNGGTVRFGRDGRLYVSLGDDATGCPAQDSTQLVGKILRLDVSRLPAGPGGPAPIAILAPSDNPWANAADSAARLVWTKGLRNPFRFNVDPATGDLVIGDVGENTWEELDLATSGGLDMGWPVREGPAAFTTCSFAGATLTEPIASYDHTQGEAIIGGPRYRRPASGAWRFPVEYDGDIFNLDYYDGQVRRLQALGGGWVPAPAVPGQPDATHWATGLQTTSDLLELSDGALWYVQQFPPGVSGGGYLGRIVHVAGGGSTGTPSGFELSSPWPSPARDGVTVQWSQLARESVRVTVHDLGGRRVRTLVAGEVMDAGPHGIAWDGTDEQGRRARSGWYGVRVRVGGAEKSAGFVLAR
jgi:glucose/arabinose dehydrogenase